MNDYLKPDNMKCWICGVVAEDPKYYFRFINRIVPLCQSCMFMGRAAFGLLQKARNIAAENGIFIGIPKNHQ